MRRISVSLFVIAVVACGSFPWAQESTERQNQNACEIPLLKPISKWSAIGPNSRLVRRGFQVVQVRTKPSPGVSDPLLEEARELELVNDFKFLSDLRPKKMSEGKRQAAYRVADQRRQAAKLAAAQGGATIAAATVAGRKAWLRSLIQDLYQSGSELVDAPSDLTMPRWQLRAGTVAQQATMSYIENLWSQLVKRTPRNSAGSLIPVPYPIIIPGARFQESYYWDSYFGIQALLRTGRWELAAMQVENFLFMIESYGLVPNGLRDYYLTRSQPPLLFSMVRDVIEAGMREGRPQQQMIDWLRDRAYPLLKRDYLNFWMNPNTRYDAATHLNHHWDALNVPRAERSAFDLEHRLGKTFRDVRAEAESGRDFTVAFGFEATRVLPVLLNSVLYKAENDLAWMAQLLGERGDQEYFSAAASRRREAMNRYLWDGKEFLNYHLDRGCIPVLSADVFATLWAGVATDKQAIALQKLLKVLEHTGGLAGSVKVSGKQWDAPFGWAPDQYFAMAGLLAYSSVDPSFGEDARRIALEWTDAIDRIHQKTGVILEKIDVVRGDVPVEDGAKYETQQGFLWTNAVWIWAQSTVLGAQFVELNEPNRAVGRR